MLHYLYGYRVLGLEGNEENINRACARQQKLYPESLTRVKYVHCKITCDSADIIESILQREFPGITNTCLIGLHACGDLSIDASRIFCKIKSIKLFILISCCYHKLSISKNIQIPLQENQYFHNFPISDCLREVIASHDFDTGQFLRVPFLRLACQESMEKWHDMTEEKHAEHSFHVLARAVLQLYAEQSKSIPYTYMCIYSAIIFYLIPFINKRKMYFRSSSSAKKGSKRHKKITMFEFSNLFERFINEIQFNSKRGYKINR